MSALKEIKTRIGSVDSTKKMTQAMKLISATRLRGASEQILNLRPYARAIQRVLLDIAKSENLDHPFLNQKETLDSPLILIVTSDRGLCGGFNGNICRFAEGFLGSFKNPPGLFFIGKKGAEYFQFRGQRGVETLFNLVKESSYPLAAQIGEKLMDQFESKKYDSAFIIYNEFKSIISPRVVCERLTPFDFEAEFFQSDFPEIHSQKFLFEVPPKTILSQLIARELNIQIYRCLLESLAAEHGSRMAAMENATKNAEEVIEKLTLTFNKLRQSSITTELTEIVAGVEALQS